MKANRKLLAPSVCILGLCCGLAAQAAPHPEWRHEQEFKLAAPGLVKISLPPQTLDAARPALEDLRLCDDAGNEVPYLVSRPAPAAKPIQAAKSFQVSLNQTDTVILLETGLNQPLDGVTLETPAMNFIKAVRVEGSLDGQTWQRAAQGQPIFRQLYGASQLHVSFPAAAWRWLRLTIDDQRSQPVPFTGARVCASDVEAAPVELQTAAISERNENPGESRITLNLGAANLDLAAIKIETDEPVFTRSVTVAVPQVTEDSISEQVIGHGVIYRVAIDGQPPSADLSVPVNARIGSRELVLLIRNEDSPPLPITAVRVERKPVYLVFMARQPGAFHLLTGNQSCAAPRYDLSALGAELKSAALAPGIISALADNPGYHAPEALAGLAVSGAALDVTAWKFRKPVQLAHDGAQQAELDLDLLAHAQPGFADLRILRGSNQAPYLIQRTSINRTLPLSFSATNDAKDPKLSRWIIKLPRPGLPLTRLACATTTPLFQRTVMASEENTDERGDRFRRPLGSAIWTRTPGGKTREFSLALDGIPQSDTLMLETENGDNAPIELEKFTACYPATRILFKAGRDEALFLYYGNPQAVPPSYDLSLVAGELLAADQNLATLGAESRLKESSWAESRTPETGGILFWGILAAVVIGLLAVISRLLPKAPPE